MNKKDLILAIFPRKNPLTHYFEKLQNKKAVPITFETASSLTIQHHSQLQCSFIIHRNLFKEITTLTTFVRDDELKYTYKTSQYYKDFATNVAMFFFMTKPR